MKKILLFLFFLTILSGIQETQAITQVDFFLTLQDGVILDCTKFIPDGVPPSGGWSSIIICHGYGLTKYSEMDWAEELCDSGFYTFVYSMRGQGISGGVSNLISTVEMNDLNQVIQYVKNESITNDNKVGLNGGSQGGILPLMAVCNGTNVRCIASELASPEFASNWIGNGSIKMTLLWTLSYTQSIVRYSSQVARYRDWILSSQKDKWDSLAHYIPINRDFITNVHNDQVPILTSNAWQDKFFNTTGVIRASTMLTAPYRMYFGAMDGHGSDTSENEFDYQDELTRDWFNYWLKDRQNGVMNPSQKFVYASSRFPLTGNTWWTFDQDESPTWPPAGTQNIRFYFQPTGVFSNYSWGGSETFVSFLNDVRDSTLTMLEAVNREFTGPEFAAKFVKTTTVYDSPPMLQDAVLAGVPKMNLFYSSTGNLCQYNFQIWCVRPNGQERLVTRLNWTDRNYTPNSTRQYIFDGEAYSHIFRQGEKIRIKVTNLDNIPNDAFLRTNPHVLPVLKRATNKIFIKGPSLSYMELPLIGYVIGIKKIENEVPQNFKLYQNYPNPFNPSTKITFDIPANLKTKVSLVIYDVTGKEVTRLFNEQQLSPGKYEAEWNSQNESSGVYFYSLKTENKSEVKKLMLVK